MSATGPAPLTDVADVLEGAGYSIAFRDLAGVEAVLGETPYALVACVQLDDWEHLEERVFDIQAALTRVADEAPSARGWDLYLVIHVAILASEPGHRAAAEAVEGDTRYARKLVRVAVPKGPALDSALRPLLPLRPPADLDLGDPMTHVREELHTLRVADAVADVAVESFRRTEEVQVP
jgi:hypothetical protein